VMAYQIDGEFAARYHGLEGIFRPDRIAKVLEKVRRCNLALNPDLGPVNFARPDGKPLDADSKVAVYGQYVVFPHEVLLLAGTCAYAGEKEFALELVHKVWSNIVLKQRYAWDFPNILDRDGKRFFGTDYDMDMILWMFLPVVEGRSLGEACEAGSLVSRVREAGKRQSTAADGSRGSVGA
jgi:uncharacterized protein (DUF608 family)